MNTSFYLYGVKGILGDIAHYSLATASIYKSAAFQWYS